MYKLAFELIFAKNTPYESYYISFLSLYGEAWRLIIYSKGSKYDDTIILEDMTGIFQPMLRCKNPCLAMAIRGFCALPRLKTPLVRYFSLIISSYLFYLIDKARLLFFDKQESATALIITKAT